jgi:hypothetical protein
MKIKKLITSVATLFATVSIANAWYTEGRVFCDANGNGQFDWDVDSPVAGAQVLVKNTAGTLSKTAVTDASGLYFVILPEVADSYAEKLNPATIPLGATIVLPPGGYYSFSLSATTPSASHLWLLNGCDNPPPPTNPGTGTPGYWKTHPEAWPIASITLGGVVYTKNQAIAIMKKERDDMTWVMFVHLVSAVLNVEIGNDDSCIGNTIVSADDWLAAFPLGSSVKASSAAWAIGEPLKNKLDSYNNGLLCAPARD